MRARPPPLEQLWERFTAFAVKINAELAHIDHRIRRLEQQMAKTRERLTEEKESVS